MWTSRNSIALGLFLCSSLPAAVELRVWPEFFRPDPFGGTIQADRKGAQQPLSAVRISAARGGYTSFHLAARIVEGGDYQISAQFPLQMDSYREWFHFNTADKAYYPDALIPVKMPYRSRLPEPDNRIPNQTAQAFWVDIWIPADAPPRVYKGELLLSSSHGSSSVHVEISVLQTVVPNDDVVTLDNNSYGTSWMLTQYPETLAKLRSGQGGENELFRLIHDYHRIFYDHRGTFHQLGYGHAGKVAPEFAPELTGSGKNRHIRSWTWFDRHYGPLLDGSAFKDSRRGSKPIPFMYLPVNPEWPASFLWWGEPGYQAEFTNVVSEMEQHFREKNWTSTTFEIFFNHKKRYKGFFWDGDEIRFNRDNDTLVQYRRLLDAALPRSTPVHFAMRADTSWSMEQQFERLKGIVSFWVAGEGMLSWYPDAIGKLKARGDTLFTYGGTPAVPHVSSEITLNPLRSWISGVQGFVRWQTVDPGLDPWFAFAGGGETLVYPGERFKTAGPLASIRLKLQRNCLQDLALLESAARKSSRAEIQQEVVRRFNSTVLSDWRNKRPPLADTPVLDWNNADIDDAMKPFEAKFANLDPTAWLRVREYALVAAR